MPSNGLPPDSPRPSLHEVLGDAVRFWEPRRIAYNAALAVAVLAWAASVWARIRAGILLDRLAAVLVLAVLANVCYCAAYLVEIPVRWSGRREIGWTARWLLWGFGTLLALALANYWVADELLPGLVH